MRPRSLIVLTGPALLSLTACTSDLPAPTNFEVLEPPPPPNDLMVDCTSLPITATGAQYGQTPTITGQLEGSTYRYSATGDVPAGLMVDEATGLISGVVEADAGTYSFDVTVVDADDPETYRAVGSCTLEVRKRLEAPLALGTVPYCLPASEDLRSLVVPTTGDGTPIVCDTPGGNGNGRVPNGVQIDRENCVMTGTIDEDRLGTWVFMMRGTQSGVEVYVPYCITNDVPQGYDITGTHSDIADATLIPVARVFDPTEPFKVGGDGDPRYEITSPGTCGGSCFFRYNFLRTLAPIADGDAGFNLSPDGLFSEVEGEPPSGFFHELSVTGPAMPPEFLRRPWVLSANITYCISGDEDGCADIAAASDGSFELGVIMVPN